MWRSQKGTAFGRWVQLQLNSDIDLYTNAPDTQMVEFATGASWAGIANGYAAIADPQTVASDAEPLLPAGVSSNRMERIQAIVQTLHREVHGIPVWSLVRQG
jgi:hypothetical protein